MFSSSITLRMRGEEAKGGDFLIQLPTLLRCLVGCSSPFMRLARRITAVRAWCKQCLHCRRKPDVLRPGIGGMRGSNGHTTTAMDAIEYISPIEHAPPPPLRSQNLNKAAEVLVMERFLQNAGRWGSTSQWPFLAKRKSDCRDPLRALRNYPTNFDYLIFGLYILRSISLT